LPGYPYTTQVAAVQARCLAAVLEALGEDRPMEPFRFEGVGAIVSLTDRGAAGNLTLRMSQRSWVHLV
jgi:NADH dehydrogenase